MVNRRCILCLNEYPETPEFFSKHSYSRGGLLARCKKCEDVRLPKKTVDERFFEKVKKTESCWIWEGRDNGKGYGSFYFNGKSIYAHRYSYEYHKGEIPSNLLVCHWCNTPSCVNPEHLYLGTQKENIAYMLELGRGAKNYKFSSDIRNHVATEYENGASIEFLKNKYKATSDTIRNSIKSQGVNLRGKAKGKYHHCFKISDEKVSEIRALSAIGETVKVISEKVGENYWTVWGITKGKFRINHD